MNNHSPCFTIDCIIYPAEILVFTKRKRYKRWHKERGLDCWLDNDALGMASHASSEKGENAFIVYVPKDAKDSAIGHEAIHIAMYMLDWLGIEINADNHESLTYLWEHIFNGIKNGLRKSG